MLEELVNGGGEVGTDVEIDSSDSSDDEQFGGGGDDSDDDDDSNSYFGSSDNDSEFDEELFSLNADSNSSGSSST
jgi:hypothetical protein